MMGGEGTGYHFSSSSFPQPPNIGVREGRCWETYDGEWININVVVRTDDDFSDDDDYYKADAACAMSPPDPIFIPYDDEITFLDLISFLRWSGQISPELSPTCILVKRVGIEPDRFTTSLIELHLAPMDEMIILLSYSTSPSANHSSTAEENEQFQNVPCSKCFFQNHPLVHFCENCGHKIDSRGLAGWACVLCLVYNEGHHDKCPTCGFRKTAVGAREESDEEEELTLQVEEEEKENSNEIYPVDQLCQDGPEILPNFESQDEDRDDKEDSDVDVVDEDTSRSIVERLMKEEEEKRKEFQRNRQLASILEDEEPLWPNFDRFKCPVCLEDIRAGEGIRMKECLHSVCAPCLKEYLKTAEYPEVACLLPDCPKIIGQREIKYVLDAGDFQKFLNLSIQTAEACAGKEAFHCLTPDCSVFVYVPPHAGEFRCEMCKKLNCIPCKAFHEGKNCRTYQDDLKIAAQNDVDAHATQAHVDALLASGQAKKCPKCAIAIQKNGGCDHMHCRMCRTNFNWK